MRCCQLTALKPSLNRRRLSSPRLGRRFSAPDRTQKRDTDGIAAIAGHNDDSMGKFSYSG
jgi:hypothetical protein